MSPALPVILRGNNTLRDPRRLPGMAAWFDGMDAATLTVDGSNRVSNWADKSGLGSRDLAQGTVGSQPTYSLAGRTLTFDGTDDSLKTAAFTLNQPTTVYFVGSQVTWTSGDALFDGNGADVMEVFQSSGGGGVSPRLRQYAGVDGGFITSLALGVRSVLCAVFSGANSVLRHNLNAPATGNAGTAPGGGFTLGSNNFLGYGNITANEIAIYNVAHTEVQQLAFFKYASRKWGVR